MWIKLCTSVNKICKKVNIWIYLSLRSAWRNSAGCYQYMCKYSLTTANDYVVLASKNRIQTWESICQKWDTYSIITRLFSIMDTLFHLLLVVVACVCVKALILCFSWLVSGSGSKFTIKGKAPRYLYNPKVPPRVNLKYLEAETVCSEVGYINDMAIFRAWFDQIKVSKPGAKLTVFPL